MYALSKTVKLRSFIYERLKNSKLPLDEIIASNVYFTRNITVPGTYLYARFGKFYLECITLYRSEWEKLEFYSAEDLCFEFVKRQSVRLAMSEVNGSFRKRAEELLKEIDEEFYERAQNERRIFQKEREIL